MIFINFYFGERNMGPMNEFPAFMKKPCNMIRLTDKGDEVGKNEGILFEAKDGQQVTFWHFPEGGKVEMHSHEFAEYCVLISGSYKGIVGGKEVEMKPGDELVIPAGVPHAGEMSKNYRSMDVFGGKRFK
jgi:mannose-6-phosphate isomerase-like protein (cupin superfamily)